MDDRVLMWAGQQDDPEHYWVFEDGRTLEDAVEEILDDLWNVNDPDDPEAGYEINLGFSGSHRVIAVVHVAATQEAVDKAREVLKEALATCF